VVVVGAARSYHSGTTMLVIGIILSIFGVGLFCWVILTLAVYALPFFVGLTAGMAATSPRIRSTTFWELTVLNSSKRVSSI
jgi:uncharacterized membrane protein HdeD (DUF308 family)